MSFANSKQKTVNQLTPKRMKTPMKYTDFAIEVCRPVDGYKLVEWSYPTSDNAKRFGFYKTGCYTLHIANNAFVPFDGHKTVAGFKTIAEAKAMGNTQYPQFPWHKAMSEGWRAE